MERPGRTRWRRDAVAWLASYLLWWLFAGSTAWPELLTGVAAATVATAATRVVESWRLAQLAPRLAWFARALWLPWYALSGTWEILVVLARHLAGRQPAPSLLFATHYDANGDDDESATRRALATAYTTMTPNFVVLDVDTSRGLLFFHQLKASATPKMTRALGARA